MPFLVFADDVAAYEAAREPGSVVELMVGACLALARLLDDLSRRRPTAALQHWRRQQETAGEARAGLGPAVARALDRHRDRPDGSRRADLSGAAVIPGDPLVVRVPVDGGVVVDELLSVDAHPLEGGPVVVTAKQAQLSVEVGAPLDPWLDRVIACLALRVAAELE